MQRVLVKLAQQGTNHFTREGSASGGNTDMTFALNALTRGNNWSFIPANDTESQLSLAVGRLDSFNARLATGDGQIYPRIDNLSGLIVDLASVMGDSYTDLKDAADKAPTFSMAARSAFYRDLGVMAGTCWSMKAIGQDFDAVIRLQAARDIFDQAAASACATQDVGPALVINGSRYGTMPSHLRSLAGDISNALNDLAYLQTALAASAIQHRPQAVPH